MFRRVVAIWLLVVLNMSLFSKWGVVAYYHVNKAYIARVLCENRDKPQLHCDGQCYLAKKLQAAEEQERKSTAERLEKLPELVLYCAEILPCFTSYPLPPQKQPATPHYQGSLFRSPIADIFHPPRA